MYLQSLNIINIRNYYKKLFSIHYLLKHSVITQYKNNISPQQKNIFNKRYYHTYYNKETLLYNIYLFIRN